MKKETDREKMVDLIMNPPAPGHRVYMYVIADVKGGNVSVHSQSKEPPIDRTDWSAATKVGEALKLLLRHQPFMDLLVTGDEFVIEEVDSEANKNMIKAALGPVQ